MPMASIYLPQRAEVPGGFAMVAQTFDPLSAKVSSTSELNAAAVCTTAPSYYRKTDQMPFDAISERSGMVSGWSGCYAFVLLVIGRVEIAVEPYINPWDSAPFKILVEEAGGKFTDFSNVPTIYHVSALAAKPILHDQMLSIIENEARKI